MYKDLSLKEKAKVLLYGGKLGLTSVEDIAKLYDDAIGHTFLGDNISKMNNPNTEKILKWNDELQDFVYSLPEVVISDKFVSRDNPNYDRAISNTYDLWKLGYLTTSDINNMRRDVRNNVLGERNKRIVQEEINRAGNKIFPYLLTFGNPAAIATLAGGELVDSTVNNLTEGQNESWGSLVSDKLGIEAPLKRAAMELTNPFYLPGLVYGGTKLLYNTAKGINNLGKVAKQTAETFRFNTDPINKTSGATMNYPWQRQSIPTKDITITTELVPSSNSNIQHNVSSILPVNNNIYSLSSSKPILQLKEPVNNPFVSTTGEINEEAFTQYVKDLFNKNNAAMTLHPSPLVRGRNANIIEHSIDAAKSAQTIPLPQGVDRQSFVTTALLHDVGEALGRQGHGPSGKALLENESFIKNNPLGEQMLDAIYNHMTPLHLNAYNILLGLRAADAARGVNYQEARLRWPSFFNYKPLNLLYDASKETIESNRAFLLNFNDYFSKYGREPILVDNLSDTEAVNNAAKEVIEKHNSFLRGVRDFKFNKNLTDEQKQASYDRMKELGMNPEDRTDRINFSLMYYVPETGSGRVGFHPDKNYSGVIYTSNDLGTAAGYATSNNGHTHNGEVALLKRPYKLGADRNLWPQEGDFVLRDQQAGPYYDLNKAILDNNIGDSEALLNLKEKGYLGFMNDPEKKQLQALIHEEEQRLFDVDRMRKDAMIAFAPDDIKQAAYLHLDDYLLKNALYFLLDVINPSLEQVGLKKWDIPNKFSSKLYVYLENLSNIITNRLKYDTEPLSKGKMFFDIKRSKVTPSQMKQFGLTKHEKLGNKIYSKTNPLIENNKEFRRYSLKTIDSYEKDLLDLRELHESLALEQFKPSGLEGFYLQPKNDELRIYTTEGLKLPSLGESGLYLHYLFPGKAGEKGLDLVRWLDRSEWVKLGKDASRGHHGKMHYPDASTKTFSKGGPIVTPYGQWKYPGRDTIIPSNNITMDNVNYPVLGVSNTGDIKVMMPWNDYKFRGSMVYEHPLIGNQFQLGGNTNPTFDLWYPTVPNQKNDTSSYDLRRAYNILPFDELEKFRTISDYHLPSVAYDEKTDIYTFLKRNGHPTLNYELDWYNSGSPDALEFRERYKLDTLSLPWRYIPRTFQKGGEIQKYLNVPDYNVALYNTVSPLGDFPNFWGALAYRRLVKDKLKNGNIYERDYKIGNSLGEKTAMAAWAKRLGIPYDELDLPVYNGDTVTLPYSLVLEIPYDTNMLKNRIQLNKALLDKYSKYRYSDVVDAAIKADLYNLDKLRETYKTGKPVGLTEFGWNSRQLVNNGKILPIEDIYSPLNVLGNYNVRYDKPTNRLYYSDEYDFNQFENFIPGESFRIRGYIDLDNNKALGGNLFKKGGSGIHIKPENKGKFTRLKKRTGHSASWFKAHGTPAQKKMAVFELNARHWNHKHNDGGYLYSEGGFLLAPYLYNE